MLKDILFAPITRRKGKEMSLFCVVGVFFIVSMYIIVEAQNLNYKNENMHKRIIVIDAGHGGFDPGKVGCNGIKEKEINLKIARYLQKELVDYGFEVELTRGDDASLNEPGAKNKKVSDMRRRIEIAENSKADMLISIHQNSYHESSVKGAQVFFYGESKEGEKLAGIIQAGIKKNIDVYNRREAKNSKEYYLLRKSNCVSVIVECGFLSNPKEAELLQQSDYQMKMAKTIADAIYLYYKEK